VPKSTGLRRHPQQTRGEHRITTILDAAATVFYEVGYATATTNLIAKHANTAIGSLYDFFPNKQAIAQRLFERYLSDLRQLYAGILTDALAQLPLPEIIDRTIDPLVQYLQQHVGIQAIWIKAQYDSGIQTLSCDLDGMLEQWTAAVFIKRYPQCDSARALRYSRICMHTVRALTALAINGSQVDEDIIADLKRMIQSYLQTTLGA
jgi:AcrR family transcriptional regulator